MAREMDPVTGEFVEIVDAGAFRGTAGEGFGGRFPTPGLASDGDPDDPEVDPVQARTFSLIGEGEDEPDEPPVQGRAFSLIGEGDPEDDPGVPTQARFGGLAGAGDPEEDPDVPTQARFGGLAGAGDPEEDPDVPTQARFGSDSFEIDPGFDGGRPDSWVSEDVEGESLFRPEGDGLLGADDGWDASPQ